MPFNPALFGIEIYNGRGRIPVRFSVALVLPAVPAPENLIDFLAKTFILPFSYLQKKSMTPMEQYDAAMELHRAGKKSEAKDALLQLAADAPDFALAYNALAAIYKKENNLPDAVKNMQKYSELEPEDSFGFSILSAFCISAGMHAEAEEALGKAHELRFQAQFG